MACAKADNAQDQHGPRIRGNQFQSPGSFMLHLVWLIYCVPAMNARLTPAARTEIDDMMWRWIRTRSRLSDAQGTEWVYHGSENHDAMHMGAFLLCS